MRDPNRERPGFGRTDAAGVPQLQLCPHSPHVQRDDLGAAHGGNARRTSIVVVVVAVLVVVFFDEVDQLVGFAPLTPLAGVVVVAGFASHVNPFLLQFSSCPDLPSSPPPD